MPQRPPPVKLLRRLEKVCEGEPANEIIFCMGIVIGQMIVHSVQPEHYPEVLRACVDAIQAGIDGPPTEH